MPSLNIGNKELTIKINNMEANNVSLTISKELVNPIIQAKINEVILEAMGGKDELVKKAIESILNMRVNQEGKVSSYSSDNKYSWLEAMVNTKIQSAMKAAIDEMIVKNEAQLRDAMVKHLSTKKGLEQFVGALLTGAVSLKDAKMTVQFGDKVLAKKDPLW